MTRFFAALALTVIAAPAAAQRIEVTPLSSAGYTPAAGIDKSAVGVEDLQIAGGFTWGAQAGMFLTDRIGLEALWTQQQSSLRLTTATGSASLFDLTVRTLHGNVVYRFRSGGPWQPFVFAGLGSTFFTADDLQDETKLSWAVGGGLKWLPHPHVGVRGHARFKPTHLDASSSSFCDPFGFCQGWLNQIDVSGGLVLRF